jgi:DNA polymerase III alpha subunit
MGKDIPLKGIFDEEYPRYGEAGDLRNLYATEPEIKQIMDTAKGIEGLIRQPGVHAAGVIMSAINPADVRTARLELRPMTPSIPNLWRYLDCS